jgi:hypothetical protein
MPEFVRLEERTHAGWEVRHAGVALVDPARYVSRLAARTPPVTYRAVALDGDLRPLCAVGGDRVAECSVCGGPHARRFDCVL